MNFRSRVELRIMNVLKDLLMYPALALLLAGCAGSAPTPEQEAAQAAAAETIDEILSTPLESEEYGSPLRCLSTYNYHSVEILDDRHVLFKGTGDRLWLNQLRNRCIGLRTNSTPVFRLRDSQLCDMDTFEGMDSMLGVYSRTTAVCSLGTFTPVTREQADVIKTALREARRR
jgi:hypothetical protein